MFNVKTNFSEEIRSEYRSILRTKIKNKKYLKVFDYIDIELANGELGYTDLWVTIFGISFTIIYSFIGWLLIMVLDYVLFRKDK